jgi:hypothetical protein
LGEGKFKLSQLPRSVQIAPVNGLQVGYFNDDNHLDAMLIGNDFGNEIISGRYDALNGVVLLGNGKGVFKALTTLESGFVVPGDAKALARLSGQDRDYYIATQNRDSLKVYYRKMPLENNHLKFVPDFSDTWGMVLYKNGSSEKIEFYRGAGYLSQSSRTMIIPDDVEKLVIHNITGSEREIYKSELLTKK